MNIQHISDNLMCSTCGGCSAICGRDAISYKASSTGRMYAVVDESCIDCGLCSKICPSELTLQLQDNYNIGSNDAVYVGRSVNNKYFINGQSGGACAAMVDYLLTNNKVDAALMVRMSYGKSPKVEAIIIESTEDLIQCQKSCYSPVPLLAALRKCKEKGSIAVVGLPCQMTAITAMQELNKYKNITYKIGLVCEGIMGATAQDVLISFADSNIAEGRKLDWKRKTVPIFSGGGYLSAPTVVYDEIGNEFILSKDYRFALKDIFTYPRCKVCNDKLNANADIVLGDPWGMTGVDWISGDSLIITRTAKGKELFGKLVSEDFVKASVGEITEVISGQQIEERKANVVRELKSHEYLNRFRKTESNDKESVIAQARLHIFSELKSKQLVQSLPYRIIRLIRRKIKRLR